MPRTASAAAGIAIVAAVATLCDFVWYSNGVRHTVPAALTYGAVLLAAVGGVVGAASGHVIRGLPIGALAGVGGALSYYVLVATIDSRTYGTAIPGAWVIMWLLFTALDGRSVRPPMRRSWRDIATRGVVAAFAAGVAFALVRNTLWGRPAGGERDYLVQFFVWAFAWAPGLLALTLGQEESATSIAAADLLARIARAERLHILDVRSEAEFVAGHVPGAVHIPFNNIGARLKDVPGTAADDLILYCGHGPRAYIAARTLRRHGRTRIVYLQGHFSAWQRAGLAIER